MNYERKARAFGSARQLKSGRWQAVFPCPTCQRKHPAHVTFETQARARKWLNSTLSDIERDRYACQRVKAQAEKAAEAEEKSRTLFGSYAERHVRQRVTEGHWTPYTEEKHRIYLVNDILPTFEDTPLDAITVEMVDDWWEAMCAKHARKKNGRKTSNVRTYELLRSIMGAAVRDRSEKGVQINPCQVEITGARRKPRIEPATDAEIDAIAGALPDRLAAAVHVAAWSAFRYGEIAELRRRDVDLSGPLPLVTVSRGVTFPSGRIVIGEPKTEAGKREVYLPEHLKPILERHLAEHAQDGPDGLLFVAERKRPGKCRCNYGERVRGGVCQGGHVTNQAFWYYYGPAVASAGREGLKVHDLRRTGLTVFAQAGATTAELMHRAGHTTPAMAMHYQQAARERDRQLALAMGKTRKTARKKAAKTSASKP